MMMMIIKLGVKRIEARKIIETVIYPKLLTTFTNDLIKYKKF